MPDPLLIEQQYQMLKQSLGLLASRRMKLLRILQFAEPLLESDNSSFLPAYAQELQPGLTGAILRTELTGTPLHFVDRLLRLLDVMQSQYSELVDMPACAMAAQRLTTYRDELTAILQSADDENLAERRENVASGVVWIPLVEREPLLPGIKPEFGSLQRLKVEVSFARRRGGKDELVVVNFSDRTGAGQQLLGPALEAAKHLLKVFTRIDVRQALSIRCWFSDTNVVVGESLEAGLAAAIFTELVRLFQYREEYFLRDDLAITGKVDSLGRLVPVDEEGLRLKVESCCYSPLKYLVVPKEQEEISTSFITAGNLHIIGASDLSEIFYNRRLTHTKHVSAIKQTARKLWKQRRPIAVITFAVVLVALAKLWYGPINREPTAIDFNGEMMLFKNKHGETLDAYDLGWNLPQFTPLDPVKYFIALLDVNEDGLKEAIWIQPGSPDGSGSWIVCCKTIREDTLRWKVSLRRKIVFPHHGEMSEDFRGRFMYAGDFDADGKPEVVLVAFHDHFPSYVVKLDASTGETLSTYVHAGHLLYGAVTDLDADGVQDILISGINNAYNEACLIVFDARFIQGHGPVTETYRVEGFEPGPERVYILFPKTLVGKAVPRERHNRGDRIDIYPDTREFRIGINDQSEDQQYLGKIYGLFGFDLAPKSFTTGSDYDVSAARLLSEGRIPLFPDKAYFEEFKKTLRYWDGTGWRNEVAANKGYLQKLRKFEVAVPKGN